ncbi:hypothetical protein N9B14_08100, partial [Akkermansiaceae bacterium]|nr:hypothetical protein [Akkermansiaceae bacterium]
MVLDPRTPYGRIPDVVELEGGMPTRECDKGIAVRDSAVKGRHATGGGAVFWVGWSVYNGVLKKNDRRDFERAA